jgi:hypothetical protein
MTMYAEATSGPAVAGPLEPTVRRLACWWHGCLPDYDHPCELAPNYVVPCKRCGAPDTSYSDRVGDSRSNRVRQWAWWWLWRKWWPAKCGACGKRFGNHEQCDDFPF